MITVVRPLETSCVAAATRASPTRATVSPARMVRSLLRSVSGGRRGWSASDRCWLILGERGVKSCEGPGDHGRVGAEGE